MQGHQIIFFTQADRLHRGQPVAAWLLQLARELGLRGATRIAASAGLGHDHRLHAAGFFELVDQPELVLLAVSEAECAQLFERLAAESVALFYLKTPAEFGTAGAGADAAPGEERPRP